MHWGDNVLTILILHGILHIILAFLPSNTIIFYYTGRKELIYTMQIKTTHGDYLCDSIARSIQLSSSLQDFNPA